MVKARLSPAAVTPVKPARFANKPEAVLRTCFPDLADATPAGAPRRLANSHVWRWRSPTFGKLFLKWRPRGVVGPVGLAGAHHAADYLRARGLPIPRPLTGVEGKPWVEREELLFEVWLAGTGEDPYADRNPFAPLVRPAHAVALGRLLAEVAHHRPPAMSHRPVTEPGVWPDTSWLSDDASASGPVPDGLPHLRAAWEEARPLVLAVLADHPWPAGPACWHHGDPLPRNMLFAAGNVSSLFDFEGWTTGPEGLDLALAVAALAFPWPVLTAGGDPRPKVARLLVEGWSEARDLPESGRMVPMIILGRVGGAFRRARQMAHLGRIADGLPFLSGTLAMLRWWAGPEGRHWRGKLA
jgi:Ser/Thr protein kinase RdoA (MazF antagonist)